MIYITTNQSPKFKQITLDDILSGPLAAEDYQLTQGNATQTRKVECLPRELTLSSIQFMELIYTLRKFAEQHKELTERPRQELYRTFYIPKHSGGLRRIDAPNPELSAALYSLKALLENQFGASYHTSAYAYVKGRCAVDAVKRHQYNDSHWFLKIDFSNFFGSTTKEFVLSQLAHIYPFCCIADNAFGWEALSAVMDLCFLNGGLPQGTPISPMLTNLIMIPIDHELKNALYSHNGERYIYTRYADDILVSSYVKFNPQMIIQTIQGVCTAFNAPYVIKPEKTRFGSRNGQNWNLGVMLNKDNQITIGHAKKKAFRAMIHSYLADKKNGIAWSVDDAQHVLGLYSYYKMVEPDYIEQTITKYNHDFNMDFASLLKRDCSV